MRAVYLILIMLTSTQFAFSKKIVVLTDGPQAATEAKRMIAEFKSKPPIDRLESLDIEIIESNTLFVNCDNGRESIARVFSCYSLRAIVRAAPSNPDYVWVIANKGYGGSANGSMLYASSVRTSKGDRPHGGFLLHEFLHQIGFDDEYEYAKKEAEVFCNKKSAPNGVYIEPLIKYPSDQYARSTHSKQIPWYNKIVPSTPITTDLKLGSPNAFIKKIGLFENSQCKNHPKIKKWKPGAELSVMEDTYGSVPEIYWNEIAKRLDTKIIPVARSRIESSVQKVKSAQ